MSATTIQVHEKLVKELERLKKERRARSYEEIIVQLINEAKTIKKSHFGTLPNLRSFEREEIDRFD